MNNKRSKIFSKGSQSDLITPRGSVQSLMSGEMTDQEFTEDLNVA